MAVLVEATSIIIRVQAIHAHYPGGWLSFTQNVPNRTFCSDDEVARIGFMSPTDCKASIEHLGDHGIMFLKDERSSDLVIADQMRGFTVACDWAEFGRIEIRPGQTVSAAQLKDTTNRRLFCPDDWKYEGSLSEQFGFIPAGTEYKSLRLLRHEQGLDVYLNLVTGREVYVGRTLAKS
jgi:hypothetical protein